MCISSTYLYFLWGIKKRPYPPGQPPQFGCFRGIRVRFSREYCVYIFIEINIDIML